MESAAYALAGATAGIVIAAVAIYYIDYIPGLGAALNRAMCG